MRYGHLALLAVLLLGTVSAVQAEERIFAADSIVADVSDRRIAVTSGYNGASTTLFGALPESGDVIITVSGPADNVVVRRKERILGLWLNRARTEFGMVPGFYWVASSRPLKEIATPDWLTAQRIGASHLRFTVVDASDYRQTDVFAGALVDLRVQSGLYHTAAAPVYIMGGRLYRADVFLPDDAPTGVYTVTTYLMQNKQLVEMQTTPLTLGKEGAMADITRAAQDYSIFYAILAVIMALLSGWASAVLMRRS